jgi:hypothetical protein
LCINNGSEWQLGNASITQEESPPIEAIIPKGVSLVDMQVVCGYDFTLLIKKSITREQRMFICNLERAIQVDVFSDIWIL